MFVQELRATVRDPQLWQRQRELWREQVRPGARGFLGSASGLTDDGQLVAVVCFESPDAARASSERPEQRRWFEETRRAFAGDPVFHDCLDVDVYGAGMSARAGFVQVMEGHAHDREAMRRADERMEPLLHEMRPDLLGSLTGWEAPDTFVTAAFFTSEEEAREREQAMARDPRFAELMQAADGPTEYYDLREPAFA